MSDIELAKTPGSTYKISQVTSVSHPFFGRDAAVTSM
jgi:hypothetical protein